MRPLSQAEGRLKVAVPAVSTNPIMLVWARHQGHQGTDRLDGDVGREQEELTANSLNPLHFRGQ